MTTYPSTAENIKNSTDGTRYNKDNKQVKQIIKIK